LIIKTKGGCTDTVIKTIVVDEELRTFIPNSFTPNGDEINDVWRVMGSGMYDTKLTVYNKWGNVVFNTKDLNVGWDGSYNGTKCLPDRYTYKLDYKNHNGKQLLRTGEVLIVK
jgi:gliding motility-associated-like protein